MQDFSLVFCYLLFCLVFVRFQQSFAVAYMTTSQQLSQPRKIKSVLKKKNERKIKVEVL